MGQPTLPDLPGAAGARIESVRGIPVVVDFGDPAGEYHTTRTGVAVYPSRERVVLEVAGGDRTDWLHNLVTQDVKAITQGHGAYSFALDAKGRIQMDFNILVADRCIRIDLDRRWVERALAHFSRYIITEDVSLIDRSGDLERISLLGGDLKRLAEMLGVGSFRRMAPLEFTTVRLGGGEVWAVRHDFAGIPGLELHVPTELAGACWKAVCEAGRPMGLRPVGRTAVRTLQIEAGIPLYGEDMDETVLPAETPVLDRAVSFTKGCYLGQEIVARMRTHGQVSRRMVGLRLADLPGAPLPLKLLTAEGKPAGRLTSVCLSPAVGAVVGLGYLEADRAVPGQRVRVAADSPLEAEVTSLPFRPSET